MATKPDPWWVNVGFVILMFVAIAIVCGLFWASLFTPSGP